MPAPSLSHGSNPRPHTMNRRVTRQILIALGVFAGIVLLFVLIAQFTG